MSTLLEDVKGTYPHDLSLYQVMHNSEQKRCCECRQEIPSAVTYYRHTVLDNQQFDLCAACHWDWITLVHAANARMYTIPVEIGTLRMTALDLVRRREFRTLKPKLFSLLGRLRDADETTTVNLTGAVSMHPVRTRIPERRRASKQEEVPAEKSAVDLKTLSLMDLISAFEKDMREAPKQFEIWHFNRSLVQRELCRRRRAILKELALHLKEASFEEEGFVREAWGRLIYRIQSDLDPNNEDTPDSFRDTEGWVQWIECFMNKPSSVTV